MFKLSSSPTYWRTVTLRQPDSDKVDGWIEQPIEVRFRWLGTDADEALMQRVKDEKLPDVEVAPLVAEGFRGVADAAGQPLSDTPENFARLLREPAVASCIVREYFASRAEAVAKN
jgi:hypothetical protein